MNTERYTFTGCGGTKLSVSIWTPDGQPKAILQIAHGMTEHIGRYDKLAEALTEQGVVVAGFDLRGHGRNSGDAHTASFGEGGWEKSLKDMHLFFAELDKHYPSIPHFMLGFSLGSFLLREYLNRYDDKVAGAAIMGTGHQPGLVLSIMCAIVKSQIKKSGFDGTTPLVQKLSFETYNQKFKPNRTEADWLCSDVNTLDQYLADPMVRENISAGLFWELLGSMKRTGKADSYAGWNQEMPVLLLYGTEDPVGNSGKGVPQLYGLMKKAGLQFVDCQQFPGARHDIFHEESNGTAESVRHCIADWLA